MSFTHTTSCRASRPISTATTTVWGGIRTAASLDILVNAAKREGTSATPDTTTRTTDLTSGYHPKSQTNHLTHQTDRRHKKFLRYSHLPSVPWDSRGGILSWIYISSLAMVHTKSEELALRTAFLYSGLTVSGEFGSLMAAGILSGMEGRLGIRAWRWRVISSVGYTSKTFIQNNCPWRTIDSSVLTVLIAHR
ncbi:hypothetical protein P691DRAFT_352084 [Macrolepiota fuliginosa MF-IS2]|uniref:Uncharacterized protein n=1 Tax=Macrolepiota fuliginosa MF-IS2 TaxID=1400762 RepID=A0A9P5XIS7_9AGAR|nr:hypothetical protein P691DRAFT_352084 [Macrolepiota fuliginosa MF-IS2]